MFWFMNHGGGKAGFRPWELSSDVRVKDSRVVSVSYRLLIGDSPFFDTAIGVNLRSHLERPNEDSPNYAIEYFPRYGTRHVDVFMAPGALDEEILLAFHPQFKCIWGWKTCQFGAELLPEVMQLRARTQQLRAERLASKDPCPLKNMYFRVRDSYQVSIGTVGQQVTQDMGPPLTQKISYFEVGLKRILHQRKNWTTDAAWSLGSEDFETSIFEHVPKKGDELLIFDRSRDCYVLPASDQNIRAVEDALRQMDNP
jgi:hypothetical protein